MDPVTTQTRPRQNERPRQAQLPRFSWLRSSRESRPTRHPLWRLLEMRLDNIIYRLGLAATRSEARYLISQGRFTVNDEIIDNPSYQVRPGSLVKRLGESELSDRPWMVGQMRPAEKNVWLDWAVYRTVARSWLILTAPPRTRQKTWLANRVALF